MSNTLLLRGAALFALTCLTLSSCQSAPTLGHEAYMAEWVPMRLPRFVSTASAGKTVAVSFQDVEADKRLRQIGERFKKELASQHKLELVEDRAAADYVVCITVRFFNESPAADNAAALRSQLAAEDGKPEPICGGYADWVDETCGALSIPDAEPIVLQFDPQTANRRGDYREWNLLIDVAVGEKGACTVEPGLHVRRTGRLLGFASGPKMTREQALEVFLTGVRPQLDPTANAKREEGAATAGEAKEAAAPAASDEPAELETNVVDVLCTAGFLPLP